ncbi:MAG: polyprenyl diphosphate synthase [Acidobacteriota bacterium]
MTPLHVAIIMDGNGRWAARRGLPRQAGHVKGGDAVRRAVEFAAQQRIGVLTLYAFSADNWRRPGAEICALLALFEEYLRTQIDRCQRAGVRLSVVGRRDRLPPSLRRAVVRAEHCTRLGTALHLRIAIDYSARDAIWMAAERMIREGAGTREAFARRLRSGCGEDVDVPDVDLLVRTGGERRLSDFLLWESAYAELCFIDVPWPDFSDEHFADALSQYGRRERRFGAVGEEPKVDYVAAGGVGGPVVHGGPAGNGAPDL